MNKIILSVAAALSLAACSTNSDGSINWADNPINHLAGKIDDGLQAANRATTPTQQTQQRSAELPDKNTRVGGGFGRNGLAPGIHESGQSYKDMMEMGYIRNNPDYPKHSKQPYVFTSMNCNPNVQSLCFHPNNFIAPRP